MKTRHALKPIYLCVMLALASQPLAANPLGPSVINGQASFVATGNALNITNSPGAIIHWQSFSIGANEATRFIQQSAASSVLNRVVGQNPSSILGALQSNGRVFLINPNGVLFGAGAQVDVAGLVVSTLNLSNADFLAGRYNFTAHAGAGGIENQGSLTALPG
ncbi:MAG TPA: filamentous hemagglutinin N-terminal domain-containing protein, partial [Gallionella sp.]|nr:filamentous hemagglutinin N-terminal domain-containing protein [Gallionella sp.]